MSIHSRFYITLIVAILTSFVSFCRAADDIPDLQWIPLPLDMPADQDARYIDFDKGDDDNPGTRTAPWKHHPWDPEATGIARRDSNTFTYYFKKGVVYRGRLIAKRSGSPERPIVLGVANDWGTGTARLSGARVVKSGWWLCRRGDSPHLPDQSMGKTWCLDTGDVGTPQALWATSGNTTFTLVPARQPNWTGNNGDDPRVGWGVLSDSRMHTRITTGNTAGFMAGDRIHVVGRPMPCDCVIRNVGSDYLDIESPEQEITGLGVGASISNGTRMVTVKKLWGTHEILRSLYDPALAQSGPHRGAILWVENSQIVKPMAGIVLESAGDHVDINLHLAADVGPKSYNRYYLEGLPRYLDAPGEFAIQALGDNHSRIMLWPPGNLNPDQSAIEIPSERILIDIYNRRYIRIAGLELAYAQQVPVGTEEARFAARYAAAIRISGNSSSIRIDHNRMHDLPAGVVATPSNAEEPQILDQLTIEDNDFSDIEGSAIALSNGWGYAKLLKTGSRLIQVNVLRNRVTNNGYRSLAHWAAGALGYGIEVAGGELVEVAGNDIFRTWGSGISVLMGSDYSKGGIARPLLRGLVHHNKVIDSVMGLQDYGGMAGWMGGPLYMYNNISGNAVGYRHDKQHTPEDSAPLRHNSFAAAYYFDGQYKGYAFNNIGWGKNNDIRTPIYNAIGFKEAVGFMNAVFNNTFYNVAAGLQKDLPQHNRNYYLGNLLYDIGYMHIQHEINQDAIDYPTLAYGHNVFHGPAANFGQLGRFRRNVYATLSAWTDNLRQHSALLSDTGILAKEDPLPGAKNHDFRPAAGSLANSHGVRFFVPWGLARVIGEWNFYASTAFPQRVTDESINMNSEWIHRSMFAQIPRRDLDCPNITRNNYLPGNLEDWVNGAMAFDGHKNYCHVSHTASIAPYEWKSNFGAGRISSQQRESLDMDGGNMLIEAVIKPSRTGRVAGLLGKLRNNGYSIHITPEGYLRAKLSHGKDSCERSSLSRLTDGGWHHIVIEFDRDRQDGIAIYVDGRLDNGTMRGVMKKDPVSNEADFTLGKVGDTFYAGAIDFLRVAKTTLRESETNVEELHQWEFNGPATRDFTGKKSAGRARTVGAVDLPN